MKEKTAFITGANKGIGFGIAKHLGLSGWRIIPLVLVILSLLFSGIAQERENRDYRAELDLRGGFPIFALAPDGTCWLTSGWGKVYYTDDIHSNWHCASSLFLVNDNTWITVHQFSFIDTNTAMAVTYDEWGKGVIAIALKTVAKVGYSKP